MTWARRHAPGQRSRVHIVDLDSETDVIVHESEDVLLEAPNWVPDGRLLVNGGGRLWLFDPASGDIAPIAVDPEIDANNDHVLTPDGAGFYASAMDGHIWAGSLDGGPLRRVTQSEDRWHFLHGVSPDGARLSYVGVVGIGTAHAVTDVRTIGVDGGDDQALTDGRDLVDGCEYSVDGAWIYFSTEAFTTAPGHMQLARMRPDGSDLQRLVTTERVEWFPHVSPDGSRALYVSFPAGTIGHPADVPVHLVLVDTADWATPVRKWTVFGGQGSLNVPSWAPDSRRFAYVDYPFSFPAA